MKKQQKITVRSYVRRQNGDLVEFADLPPEVKERAALELKARYLNGLFAGRATFAPENGKIVATLRG